jgi:lysophospholipase L1-like esterase
VPRTLLKTLKGAGFTVLGVLLLLVGEGVYAYTRDYPLNDPEQPIKGEFGDPSLPRLRFVVLGDSTSVGVGTTPENSFPWLLATELSDKFHVELNVVGVGGAVTADVADIQVDKALALDPDLILVEIGANDTTHGTPLRRVQSKIAEALDRLEKSGAAVVVAGPPNMGTSPTMPQPLRMISGWRGNAVGRRIEEEARKRDLPYIDLAAGTRDEFRNNPDKYYSVDWFHPGTGGYKLWAEVMLPTVRAEAERRL